MVIPPSGYAATPTFARGVDTKKQGADEDIDTLISWMCKSFTNAEQVARDTTFPRARFHVRRVWGDAETDRWLFCSLVVDHSSGRERCQWFFRVHRVEEGIIECLMYVPSGKLPEANRIGDSTEYVIPRNLVTMHGCEVYLQATAVNFSGGTHGFACRLLEGNLAYTTIEIEVRNFGIRLWLQGFNEQNEQKWGSASAPFLFVEETAINNHDETEREVKSGD